MITITIFQLGHGELQHTCTLVELVAQFRYYKELLFCIAILAFLSHMHFDQEECTIETLNKILHACCEG